MNNVTPFTKAPAGFKLEHFCSCGMGCTPDDLNADDNCEILGSNYAGPGAHIIGPSGGQVNSYWSAKDGITFQVLNYRDNDKGEYVQHPWTRNELDQLPAMVDRVKIQIDEAHARQYFADHPELLKTVHTVNDMARIADDHDLQPSVVYTVWAEVNAEEAASWK